MADGRIRVDREQIEGMAEAVAALAGLGLTRRPPPQHFPEGLDAECLRRSVGTLVVVRQPSACAYSSVGGSAVHLPNAPDDPAVLCTAGALRVEVRKRCWWNTVFRAAWRHTVLDEADAALRSESEARVLLEP